MPQFRGNEVPRAWSVWNEGLGVARHRDDGGWGAGASCAVESVESTPRSEADADRVHAVMCFANPVPNQAVPPEEMS